MSLTAIMQVVIVLRCIFILGNAFVRNYYLYIQSLSKTESGHSSFFQIVGAHPSD
jgi:hypothetical protein